MVVEDFLVVAQVVAVGAAGRLLLIFFCRKTIESNFFLRKINAGFLAGNHNLFFYGVYAFKVR